MFRALDDPYVVIVALIAAAACYGFLHLFGERFLP
jgi:hypothetical protein